MNKTKKSGFNVLWLFLIVAMLFVFMYVAGAGNPGKQLTINQAEEILYKGYTTNLVGEKIEGEEIRFVFGRYAVAMGAFVGDDKGQIIADVVGVDGKVCGHHQTAAIETATLWHWRVTAATRFEETACST